MIKSGLSTSGLGFSAACASVEMTKSNASLECVSSKNCVTPFQSR